MKNILKKLKPTRRKIIQLYMALLFNSNLYSFATKTQSTNIYTGDTKKFCIPGLNCYSCPGAVGACPLGSLQGSFSADKSTLFYVGGILLLYCILFGRFICGWLCPFGLIQELLYKIKTPKLKKNKFTKFLSYIKYVILAIFVIGIPIAYAFRNAPFPAFCKFICPAGTLEGGLSLLANKVNDSQFSALGPLFTWKFILMVSILIACIFIFRMFCRFICPLGALYGLFNKFSIFGIKLEQSKCINCNLCKNKCKMDITHVGDMECISCGECIDVCPTNAIVWKGIRKNKNQVPADDIKKHKTARLITRIITAFLMIAILITSITYFWIETSNKTEAVIKDTQSAEYGFDIGDKCYSDDLLIINQDGITNNTIDPTKTGKITVINFWGTWCSGCVKELPEFDNIATDYKNTVSVVAVHTYMMNNTAPEYIKNNYSKSNMIFASDKEDESYYAKLGGSTSYPYTVIIDENGIIRATFTKTLHYEDLKKVIDNISNK